MDPKITPETTSKNGASILLAPRVANKFEKKTEGAGIQVPVSSEKSKQSPKNSAGKRRKIQNLRKQLFKEDEVPQEEPNGIDKHQAISEEAGKTSEPAETNGNQKKNVLPNNECRGFGSNDDLHRES